MSGETYHPVIQRRLAKQRGQPLPPSPPLTTQLRTFAVTSLGRPIRILLTEPTVLFICLYVACEFGTLFSFFAGVPYTFGTIYGFDQEQSGLVFVALVVGCLLGFLTIILCDRLHYRPQMAKYPPHQVPPEHRLYPALIGSVGLPLALFWFAWTARADISWASPAAAIVPFGWGNICLFVSTTQYITDTYHGNVVASAMSANTMTRYGFGAVFPLFALQSEYFSSPSTSTSRVM